MEQKRSNFSGSLGFVLAAAGSAVGLGNIWRFPYLAAKDGGGIFLLCYVVLALTFGFALLTTEIAIGRKTGQSPITAYKVLHPKWGWIGLLACLIPLLILPYYSAIGGWILKYLAAFLTGNAPTAAEADGYFGAFITSPVEPVIWFAVFLAATTFVVYKGVNAGIERMSKVMMPLLLVLIICIAVFSLTLSHTDESGVTRTGLEGLKFYLIPNFQGMTVSRLLTVITDAMGQLFYSISVAMGIMITYGSYVKPDVDLNRSISQIEFFDTGVALLAGAMIVPAVYVFSGTEGMGAGPSLMFISLPKVFDAMGFAGTVVGILFFVSAIFATLTSCISVLEAITANCMEIFHTSRKKTVLVLSVIYLAASAVIALGYSVFYFEVQLPNGSAAQLLDIMDYVSNSVMMPLISLLSTILIGWVLKPQFIAEEMEKGSGKFTRKALYTVIIRYVAPIVMLILFLQSTGILA